MRTILAQRVASTRLDRSGERLSKAFLDHYVAGTTGARQPLHDEHDVSRPTIGYAENHRVQPDPDNPDEWLLLADIYLDDNVPLESFGGFSISAPEMIREPESADAQILLTYPHYNDEALLRELSGDEHLALGKWIRKGVGDFDWDALLIGLLILIFTPAWEDVYRREIAPRISRLRELFLQKLHPRGIGAELIQSVEFKGQDVQVHFIPERQMEAMCLDSESVLAGLRLVFGFLQTDQKSNNVGARRIVVFYDRTKSGYALHRIEYVDGSVEHLA